MFYTLLPSDPQGSTFHRFNDDLMSSIVQDPVTTGSWLWYLSFQVLHKVLSEISEKLWVSCLQWCESVHEILWNHIKIQLIFSLCLYPCSNTWWSDVQSFTLRKKAESVYEIQMLCYVLLKWSNKHKKKLLWCLRCLFCLSWFCFWEDFIFTRRKEATPSQTLDILSKNSIHTMPFY